MDNKTILIIDDNKTILLYIEAILKNKGFNVISKLRATEALIIMESSKIDMIICDVIMPELTGLELFNILKTNQKYSNIPFILMTGSINMQKIKELKKEGIQTIIHKSNLIKELVIEINNNLLLEQNCEL
ncbi:MAG: hypothetical protein A2X12_01635 [Bacteroidetes bacterium GWE2_29_8]|nr:MAG: hypothetical protein A2X12_01635 [Bacteroidetes bacterium GWE2_29_8]